MVASSEAVLFAQFHSGPLQLNILAAWDKQTQSLDCLIYLTIKTRLALAWWISNPGTGIKKSFLLMTWKGLKGAGDLVGFLSNILKLTAIWLPLQCWTSGLQGHPTRIE